jgi:hypothetical protein
VTTGQHVLLIAPVGLMEVIHTQKTIDVEATLRARGAVGDTIAHITFGNVTVMFCPDPEAPLNTRAREALASTTGVHVVVTGPALFFGLDEEQVFSVIRLLSDPTRER